MVEKKPKIQENEMEKLQDQFDKFDANVKELTKDRMDMTPKVETEPQTKLAQSEIEKAKQIHLKPSRSIGSREKFNEQYREQYNFDKEYVQFIAENNEIKGDMIEMWTKPYPGMPAEFWQVPVNKPIWAPRYVAEQIKRKSYHRLTMEHRTAGGDGMGQYYGQMAVDTTIQRLDARPVSTRKSIFMGAVNF
jgi:hypothetical protein